MRLAWILVPLLLAACVEEKPVVAAPGAGTMHAASPNMAMAPPEMGEAGMQGTPEMGAPRMREAGSSDVEALASRSAAAREDAVIDYEGDLAQLAPLATGDASPSVRLAAVQRLADGETPVARAALRRALEDEDPEVLAEAILAVTTAEDRKAVPALRKLRAHPDDEVRGLADDALIALAR